MRAPTALGDLLPVAVPGLVVLGALVTVTVPTRLGALAFRGPWIPLVVGLVTALLVIGYLVAGIQEHLATRHPPWSLPPAAGRIEVPLERVAALGFEATGPATPLDLPQLQALERSLAGAWGVAEGEGWDRVAYRQRLVLAFGAATAVALVTIVGAVASGSADHGIRSHAGTVLVLAAPAWYFTWQAARRARVEAALALLADARALLLDRGPIAGVTLALQALGISRDDVLERP